jgi:hypothetical protein
MPTTSIPHSAPVTARDYRDFLIEGLVDRDRQRQTELDDAYADAAVWRELLSVALTKLRRNERHLENAQDFIREYLHPARPRR